MDSGRFWGRVRLSGTDECWLWQGGITEKGYGTMWVNRRNVRAHRIAWELVNGPIPDGQCCLHKCDRRLCVNPSHLFLGNNADNVADMVAKNRQAKGAATGHTKLTECDVLVIRERLASGETQESIASDFGVGQSSISCVALGLTWKHVEPVRHST